MGEPAIEGIRASVLLIVFLTLWKAGKARPELSSRRWGILLRGLLLLLLGNVLGLFLSLVDLSTTATSMCRFVALFCYAIGLALVSIGMISIMPTFTIDEQRRRQLYRARRQFRALTDLLQDPATLSSNLNDAARVITQSAAEALETERVGVWLLNDDRTLLNCIDLYQRSKNEHSRDDPLLATEYPKYFEALRRGRAVAVHDARQDPRTSEFAQDYLAPRQTSSMLDAPIRVMGEVVGVVCHEHIGEIRFWADDEISFAAQIADHVGHALAGERQKIALERLQLSAQALKSANEALERSGTANEAAAKAKSEFLANMSHEIRTPMTAILGFADVLREGVREPELQDAIITIRDNGEHLLQLLNDILDLSKIEAGKLELDKTDYSPAEVVSEVVSLMRLRADSKGLPLIFEQDGPLPQTVRTDPLRLRQVLINLVGNAIKFTEKGEVRLVVRLQEPDAGRPRLLFDVIDTGIGISHEQRERVFQPFTQADTSTSREYGGTGLGLTISKRIAEQLGGEITIESEPRRGSIFRLAIDPGELANVARVNLWQGARLATPNGSQPAHPPLERMARRVLLAEDGPDNQRLIAFLLRRGGSDVALAENGRKAVQIALEARDSGHPFDVILMDMQMPLMDGYEATRKLRLEGYDGRIVALTAHAMQGDCQKCLDCGCDDYVSKPIQSHRLFEVVAMKDGKADERRWPKPLGYPPIQTQLAEGVT